MARSARMGSLLLLICAIALTYSAVLLGAKVAWMLAHPDGFTPFLLIAGTWLAFVGLVICWPLGAFQPGSGKSTAGSFLIAGCAAVSLLLAAYLFGLTKNNMPVDLGGGTNVWALVLLAGLVPVLVTTWNVSRRQH